MAIDSTQFSSSTVVLVGLASSIITIGISKVLDLIQRRQEHRYSLQKTFFEKKLEMAEQLVAFFYRMRMICQSLKLLLEKTPDMARISTGRDWILSQVEEIGKRANKLVEETNSAAFASPLYFDLDEMDSFSSDLQQIVTDSLVSLYQKLEGLPTEENLSEAKIAEVTKILAEWFAMLKATKLLIDSAEAKMDKFIRSVRSEMGKYRP